MKGVIFEKVGAEPQVVDNLEKPKPSPDQILVKSIYAAINPVDSFMCSYGILVVDWPLVLGVDAAGIIVEVGENAASKFKVGDEVCGCTRLGSMGYSTCQEFFLMDAGVTIPKPKNITLPQAATVGVASLTACLGLFNGLNLPLPSPTPSTTSPPTESAKPSKSEYLVILGGASSVGQMAIQIAIASGLFIGVLASCSMRSAPAVRGLGAIPFDYKKSIEEQVKDVLELSAGGKFTRVFDAVAGDGSVGKALLEASKVSKPQGARGEKWKYFATTNDWSGIKDFESSTLIHEVKLGQIGRPMATELNKDIGSFIPMIAGWLAEEKIRPSLYDVVGKGGMEDAIKAYEYQKRGAGGSNKVVVKIQDP